MLLWDWFVSLCCVRQFRMIHSYRGECNEWMSVESVYRMEQRILCEFPSARSCLRAKMRTVATPRVRWKQLHLPLCCVICCHLHSTPSVFLHLLSRGDLQNSCCSPLTWEVHEIYILSRLCEICAIFLYRFCVIIGFHITCLLGLCMLVFLS